VSRLKDEYVELNKRFRRPEIFQDKLGSHGDDFIDGADRSNTSTSVRGNGKKVRQHCLRAHVFLFFRTLFTFSIHRHLISGSRSIVNLGHFVIYNKITIEPKNDIAFLTLTDLYSRWKQRHQGGSTGPIK